MGKSFVILNPRSGRGAGARHRTRITSALAGAGIDFDMVETEAPGHGVELADACCRQGYDRLIAAGGDGTIHEALNGVMCSEVETAHLMPLAAFPVGSGNDFATMLGYPKSYEEVARKIARGQQQQIDVGVAVVHTADRRIERYFGNNVGIGFEAKVTLESYAIENMSGAILYAIAALRALRKFQSPMMNITWVDGQGKKQKIDNRTLMVSVGNSARTGGGFYLNPTARMDDGLLDVAIAGNLPKWQVLLLLPQAMRGSHTNHAAVTMARYTELHVQSSQPIPVHVDGEVVADDVVAVEIKIRPGALRVVV